MFAGTRLNGIYALALMLLCGHAAALDMNDFCLLVKSGTMLASPADCTSYYLCQNGLAVLETCSQGYAFNKDQQQCVLASQVGCSSSSDASPCAQYSVGSWAPVPNSCSGYYYCSANGPERSNCPSGENFNPQTQSCVYASDYQCSDTTIPSNSTAPINLCDYVPNGVYFGNAFSCSGWNYCQNNQLTSGSCNTTLGQLFDTTNLMCDYTSACTQVTSDPDLLPIPTTCDATKNTIIPAAACNQYYTCVGSNYVLQQCSSGEFFDTTSNQCVTRVDAVTENCNRCAGTTMTFVNSASNTGCTGYIYCVNGVESGQGTCPSGSYFNEDIGACTQGAQPDFGCCNPSAR